MLPSCLVFSDKREKNQLAPQVATVKTEYVSPSPADHEDEADDVEPAPAGAGAAGGGGGKPVSAELVMKQVRICRRCLLFFVAGLWLRGVTDYAGCRWPRVVGGRRSCCRRCRCRLW